MKSALLDEHAVENKELEFIAQAATPAEIAALNVDKAQEFVDSLNPEAFEAIKDAGVMVALNKDLADHHLKGSESIYAAKNTSGLSWREFCGMAVAARHIIWA